MSSFFKRLGGLLLVRACYSAKRKDFLSGSVCTVPLSGNCSSLGICQAQQTPNPVLFRPCRVLVAQRRGHWAV